MNKKNKVTISRESIEQFEVFFFFSFISSFPRPDPLYHDLIIQSIPNELHNFFISSWCFWPEIFLLLSIIILTLHKNIKLILFIRFNLTGLLIIFSYWSVIYLTVPVSFFTHFYFSNYYFFDYYIFLIKLIFFMIFLLFFSIIFFRFFYDKKLKSKEIEFYRIVYILFLSFWLFSFLLVSSNNLFGFYFILEGLSFIIIFSCVLNFNKSFCLLTSIRYFTLNAFASGCFLFSIIILQVLYQTVDLFYLKNLLSLSKTGIYKPIIGNYLKPYIELTNVWANSDYEDGASTTTFWDVIPVTGWVFYSVLLFFVFFIVGCFFKLGCFPFNWWILSINLFINYETFFLFNVIFKNLFFFYFFRVITYYFSMLSFLWIPLFLFIGFSTVMIGTFGLFSQKRLKGFFTFSSMIQIGYVFIGIALTTIESFTSIFFLHLIYLLNSVIVFSILLYFSSDIRVQSAVAKSRNVFFGLADLSLLRLISPLVASVFTIAILSFAGLPPTFGFFAKYYYFEVIVKTGLYKLCIVLLILNAISLYPYINILKNLWFTTNIKTFSTTLLPVFSREYFMVSTLKYYMFFNLSAIFFYKIVIEFCHKMSYCGSRIIFAQWFDGLPYKGIKLYTYLYHRLLGRRLTKLQLSKPEYGPQKSPYVYGPGYENSTLVSKKYDLDLYIAANRRTKRLRVDEFFGFDNFSDSICTSGSDADYMAFTVIGTISLFLLANCFLVCYIREQHVESHKNVVLLSWTSFGGREPFLFKLRRIAKEEIK